jgi:hypothetical protein
MALKATHPVFREPEWFRKICLTLYKIENKYWRKLIRTILLGMSHSQFYSLALREIYDEYHKIKIGLYSYGLFAVDLSPGTVVGRYTSVAAGLMIIHGNHPIKR